MSSHGLCVAGQGGEGGWGSSDKGLPDTHTHPTHWLGSEKKGRPGGGGALALLGAMPTPSAHCHPRPAQPGSSHPPQLQPLQPGWALVLCPSSAQLSLLVCFHLEASRLGTLCLFQFHLPPELQLQGLSNPHSRCTGVSSRFQPSQPALGCLCALVHCPQGSSQPCKGECPLILPPAQPQPQA